MSFSNIMHKNSIAKKNRCTHMVILYHMVDYIVSFLPFSAGSIQNREKISICHACRYAHSFIKMSILGEKYIYHVIVSMPGKKSEDKEKIKWISIFIENIFSSIFLIYKQQSSSMKEQWTNIIVIWKLKIMVRSK